MIPFHIIDFLQVTSGASNGASGKDVSALNGALGKEDGALNGASGKDVGSLNGALDETRAFPIRPRTPPSQSTPQSMRKSMHKSMRKSNSLTDKYFCSV